MSRARVTVSKLAQEAGIDSETALLILLALGVKTRSAADYVPRSKLNVARRSLGLGSARESRLVAELARRASLSEDEARGRLLEVRLLRDPVQLRVRREVVRRAETALGIRQMESAPVPSSAPDLADRTEPREGAAVKEKRPRKKKRSVVVWPLIGKQEEISYLTAGDVEQIHHVLVEDFAKSRDPILPAGVSDRTLLESAVFRPHTALTGHQKYPTISMAGAALFYAVVHDHAFFNGNKRTALVSLLVFLDKNGYVLTLSEDDLFEYVLRLASHQLVERDHRVQTELADRETIEVARWLQRNMKRVTKGEFVLRFDQLKRILATYECQFEVLKGNRINIARGGLRTQVAYSGVGMEVDRSSVHKIRKDLYLDEVHGYDSDIFYNAGPRIDDFIGKYRRTLDRLAKL